MRNTQFWLENLKGRDHLEDLGVDGRMILKKTGCKVIDWMHLAQDRDQWRAFVKH
jgi:hypothetical protein